MSAGYTVCFVSHSSELERFCSALLLDGLENCTLLLIAEVRSAGEPLGVPKFALPPILPPELRVESVVVGSPVAGRAIDPLAPREAYRMVKRLGRHRGAPARVVVTGQYGWRGLLWRELARAYEARMVFAPEGIGVLTNDPFASFSSGQAVRRYAGDFADFVSRDLNRSTGAGFMTVAS